MKFQITLILKLNTVTVINIGNHVWTKHDLDERISNATKEAIWLPKAIMSAVLQSVLVLLVTTNINETLAAQGYLQQLHGYENVYKFHQNEQGGKFITYYIGTYGSCPAALLSSYESAKSLSNLTLMACQCFF